MQVRFKKIRSDAVAPSRAHSTDAGFDLTATSRDFVNGHYVYGTGIAVEIPRGYVGLVFPRSSVSKKDLILSNGVGVIDSGYRGEILLKFKPSRIMDYLDKDALYEVGDRIGQLVIIPYPEVEFSECDELSETDRGEGGYGSSGR